MPAAAHMIRVRADGAGSAGSPHRRNCARL